jgi:polyhydroxyalkanoate synthase
VVRHFLRQGFDTYLIDWGAPTHAHRHLGFDDYVNGYLSNVVDYVRERAGVPHVNVLGYCMGGTMSAMFTGDGLLNLWTRPEYFDVDKFIDTLGNCPAEFLQSTFLLLKPVQNLVEKQINFFENADNEKFLDDFLTMETWLNDNIPVAGEIFRQFVKYLYQANLLVQNKLPVGKHLVNLRQITCPILNLMARSDDLVPCAQSAPFNDLVGSADRKSIVVEAGHVGLAVGSKAQKEAWPTAAQWLAERS